MRVVGYRAAGWGEGELAYDADGRLLYHELPAARRARQVSDEPDPLAERIRAYFAGEAPAFDDVDIDLEPYTPFGREVARALRGIPYGETVTYGELAALAGHPNAQRAVGSFCARNRFGLVVPCHRVVGAAGVGPYGSLGSAYKARLLALEAARPAYG